MKLLSTKEVGVEEILKQLQAARVNRQSPGLETEVRAIIAQVKKHGDPALFQLTERLDGAKLSSLRVTSEEIKQAVQACSPKLRKALAHAKRNIEKFHQAVLRRKEKPVATEPGITVWREFRPVERVGLYVPGGTAAYPSTVLMLGIPANLAGCRLVILCTPAGKDGKCNPAVLAAASLCGIREIFKLGGAQAIAAMAYGTETVPKVSKIFGPGNPYVTTAKMLLFGEVNIDMPAGPSEVLVVADESAKPAWVAADLLSQLEHGANSQAVLITFSHSLAGAVREEIQRQLSFLSRKTIIQKSLAKSFIILAKTKKEVCQIVNEYAPEHLELAVRNPAEILTEVTNAGSIFLGHYSNEPLGDYATGANHTLATSGFAKMFSALSTESFGKMIQVQAVTSKGLERLRESVETLAAAEGLDAHANAVRVRFA